MFRFEKLYPKAPWEFQTSQLALDMALSFYIHSSAVVLSVQTCAHTYTILVPCTSAHWFQQKQTAPPESCCQLLFYTGCYTTRKPLVTPNQP